MQVDTVPKLRAFGLVDDNKDYAQQLTQTGILGLVPQLDVLSIDMQVWENLEPAFRNAATQKTLVDVSVYSMDRPLSGSVQIRNLRCYTTLTEELTDTELSEIADSLDDCTTVIRNLKSPSLNSLYLDHSLVPSDDSPADTDSAVENLLDACKGKGINVYWDSVPNHFEFDQIISQGFWRRRTEGQV